MRWTKCLIGLLLLALLPAPCAAVDPAAVNRTIDRGVAALKQRQTKVGSWWYSGTSDKSTLALDVGMTALAGFTLLHCKMPATDPSIARAAAYVRRFAPVVYQNQGGVPQVYSVSVAILFLDRLGQPQDDALIRKLAAQLLYAQEADGGWRYRLDHGQVIATERRWGSDNCNSYFAVMALWAAHRHGVRISRALAAAARRVYAVERRDGGWPYVVRRPGPTDKSTASMTCASLLTLAYRYAAANKAILKRSSHRRPLAKVSHDRAVAAGLAFLNKRYNQTVDEVQHMRNDPGSGLDQQNNWCFALWCVEQVAAAYSLEKIGGVDWYEAAAENLVAKQKPNGTWPGSFRLADTCFALLVLRRANLSPDVTALLKGRSPPRKLVWSIPLKKKTEHKPDIASNDILAKGFGDKKPDDAAIQTLLNELAQADNSQQDRLLHTWRDGEDARYTPALAKAIATLSGPAERKARAALADRLTRLNVHERDEYLHSDDPEIRRAAVLSCAVRADHQHIARLIELLKDNEAPVARAAHAVLCSLTGQDFGPNADASQADRDRAVTDWKTWWNKKKKNEKQSG